MASKSILDNLMSIESLMQERERLDEVINAAVNARHAKTQINKLIALYAEMRPSTENVTALFACEWPGCDRTFPRTQGRAAHMRSHTNPEGVKRTMKKMRAGQAAKRRSA